MKKIMKFKSWLTLEQASIYLTTILEEPVEPIDILQLALDEHLTLSFNFLENIPVRPVKIIEYEAEGFGRTIELDVDLDSSTLLSGVLDIQMVFDARIFILEKCRELSTEICEIIQLKKDIVVEHQGELYKVCQYIMNPNFTEVNDMTIDDLSKPHVYYQIPNNTEIVVRTHAIEVFIEKLKNKNEKSSVKKAPLDIRSETSYLNIIGGLLVVMQDKSLNEQQRALFGNQSAIIKTLLDNKEINGCYGISQTNLDIKFAAAKKSLNSA
jgi:hypothetical protein